MNKNKIGTRHDKIGTRQDKIGTRQDKIGMRQYNIRLKLDNTGTRKDNQGQDRTRLAYVTHRPKLLLNACDTQQNLTFNNLIQYRCTRQYKIGLRQDKIGTRQDGHAYKLEFRPINMMVTKVAAF